MILKYTEEEINTLRSQVSKRFIVEGDHISGVNFEKLFTNDLRRLAYLYDEIFLNNFIEKNSTCFVNYDFSRRFKSSGGNTKVQIHSLKGHLLSATIQINVDMVFEYQHGTETRYACGLEVKSNLDVLMFILEHELCHLLEFIIYGNSNCSDDRFKEMAKDLFNHKESSHNLMTQHEKVTKDFNILVGDQVRFAIDNKKYKGTVQRINKRATVYVKNSNGNFYDKTRQKYCDKYLIPLEMLVKVK